MWTVSTIGYWYINIELWCKISILLHLIKIVFNIKRYHIIIESNENIIINAIEHIIAIKNFGNDLINAIREYAIIVKINNNNDKDADFLIPCFWI